MQEDEVHIACSRVILRSMPKQLSTQDVNAYPLSVRNPKVTDLFPAGV